MKSLKIYTGTSLVFSCVLFLATQAASAASVSSQLFPSELNQFSDNSAESQNVDLNSDGFLGVGDTLRGILEIETIEDLTGSGGTNHLGGTSGNNELSGIFEVVVTALTVLTDPDGSFTGGGVLSGDETANYVFGVYAPFALEFGLTAGSMVALFEDSTPDFDRNLTTQAAAEATATDGTLAMELGFFGDADELWAAFGAPTDPSLGSTSPAGSAIGSFNVQLSIGFNALFPGLDQVDAAIPGGGGDGLIDVNGSGGLRGTKGITSFYDIFDNVDLVVIPTPEPSSFVLFGIGGMIAGVVRRRRKSGCPVA